MRVESDKFHGRRVLITGCARRVGRAVARHLAMLGADIIIHYNRSEADALSLAKEIRELGRKADLWHFNLADVGTLEKEIVIQMDELSPFDVLINNASPYLPVNLSEINSTHWNEYLAVHLLSPFFLSRAFADRLAKERGDIINLLDARAALPRAGFLPYGVTKVALEQLTKNLAQELAPKVRVNGVAPGYVLTPINSEQNEVDIGKAVLLKRRGDPQDVAEAIEFLLSASYVTGEVLHVDGGRGCSL